MSVPPFSPLPKLIVLRCSPGVCFLQVVCGDMVTLALTNKGNLFAWGNGETYQVCARAYCKRLPEHLAKTVFLVHVVAGTGPKGRLGAAARQIPAAVHLAARCVSALCYAWSSLR
jgi:hypothetical protein